MKPTKAHGNAIRVRSSPDIAKKPVAVFPPAIRHRRDCGDAVAPERGLENKKWHPC
jgi:hypothetical protein